MKSVQPSRSSAVARLVTTCVLLLALAVAASAVVALAKGPRAAGSGAAPAGATARHWVTTWTAMPQLTEPGTMPPPPFTEERAVLVDTTLRQTVRVSTGGGRIRLRFSNAFGDTALPLTAVSVALPLDGRAGVSAVEPDSPRRVPFTGRASAIVPVGTQLTSEPIDFGLAPGSDLTVTAYLAEGQPSTTLTSHTGSRTTSYLRKASHCDHTQDLDLPGATAVNHWYLLRDVEVLSGPGTAAVAVLGDSPTDGRGSTTDGNDRWTDRLLDRLRAHPATDQVAVLNQAAGGNPVLNDGLGPNVLARLDRDVLSRSGVLWLVVFEGGNDIGTAAATPAAQRSVTAELIAAYERIVVRAHAQGIRVYGATLTPIGRNAMYDDPAGHREASRQAVNSWIRTSGRFDAVVDFDPAVRDPEDPRRPRPTLHDGAGRTSTPRVTGPLAAAVPRRLFPTRAD